MGNIPRGYSLPKVHVLQRLCGSTVDGGFYRVAPNTRRSSGPLDGTGGRIRFYVEDTMLPEGLKIGSGVDVRFYVQGVTDRGEVLPWVDGVFVDAKL
jgi:hypothetical protein